MEKGGINMEFKMKKKLMILFAVLVFINPSAKSNDRIIPLDGKWQTRLDPEDVGVKDSWYEQEFTDTINLPGSLQEQGLGDSPSLETEWVGWINTEEYAKPKYDKYKQPGNFKFPFWLTPERYYKGIAWYQKEVNIPLDWKNKRIFLELERCHWETSIYIDGQYIGSDSSLCTPHRYELTHILQSNTGFHKISIRVDNRMIINVGPNSHSISDHTQSNWNGIVGKIQLGATPLANIEDVKIYPDIHLKSAKVIVTVNGKPDSSDKGTLTLQASSVNVKEQQVLESISVDVETTGKEVVEVEYPMSENPLLWDEFEPNLYIMDIRLEIAGEVDNKQIIFGMREIKAVETRIHMNDRPTFMRGTLECAIFPRTGYPPTDVEEWRRIFQIMKSYGLNHMRFHSWCPPEAAFIAADLSGVYLHVEGPSWANLGATVGDGEPIDKFIYSESERIMVEYGNHPSFCMFAYGNEPGGKHQKEFLGKFVTHFKNKDNRRLYTAGAGWPIIPENDYLSSSEPRIQHWGEGLKSVINAQAPNTQFDYREIITEYNRPMISHEIGQWCVYPNFDEIKKYTGVLKAKNFEIFRDFLAENHMEKQAKDFLIASGKLQSLCYKADIEAALRTPGFAGFQLLDLHDFPGQGTALVGVLDPFWDEKGYITAKEYNRFCNSTVPLALMPKFIWTDVDTFLADIQIAHFGKQEIQNAEINWRIVNDQENSVYSGAFRTKTIFIDNCQSIGRIELPLYGFQTPQKLKLIVSVDRQRENDWNFWIYPKEVDLTAPEGIIVTEELSPEITRKLKDGARVLLQLHGKIKQSKGAEVAVGFSSIFWNTVWTNNQAPHILGILCQPEHLLFEDFPTEFHSNWQWWDIIKNSQTMQLHDLPEELQPSIQLIDTWFEARRLALLFEGKINEGKIIVTSIDFQNNLEKRLATRQLYASLLRYMNSESFAPATEITVESLQNLYK